jgi:hypothetical protein
VHTTE